MPRQAANVAPEFQRPRVDSDDNPLYESVSSAAFQMNTAVQGIIDTREALDQVRTALGAKDKADLDQISGFLNQSGEVIGDFPSVPGTPIEMKSDPDRFKAWDKRASAAAHKALILVLNSEQIAGKLPESEAQGELCSKLLVVEDALKGSISASEGRLAEPPVIVQ